MSPFECLAIVSLGAWLLVAALACFSVYNVQRDRPPVLLNRQTAAVLIIPVRGVPAHLDALWRGICSQTDRLGRVIFAIESREDPAYEALRSLPGGLPTEIAIAGPTTQRSQKVHNLLAALGRLRPDDSVIVFADADIAPDPYWLARLNRGLDDAHIASGYRWLVPTDDRWATAFTCVANSSVATAQRRLWNLAWGGSLALRRRLLGELEIEKVWDRAVSDDLPLTQAVKARGIRIVGPRDALVQSPASYSWREAITFGRRQYLFLRIHAPFHWAMVAAVTTIPLLGWIAALSLILTNATLAVGVIVVANSLDHLRAYFRRRVSRKLWGTGISRRVAWLDSWGTPAVLAGHALIIWSTLVGRSVTWADRVYWVDRSAEVHQIKQLPGSDASGTLRTQEV